MIYVYEANYQYREPNEYYYYNKYRTYLMNLSEKEAADLCHKCYYYRCRFLRQNPEHVGPTFEAKSSDPKYVWDYIASMKSNKICYKVRQEIIDRIRSR